VPRDREGEGEENRDPEGGHHLVHGGRLFWLLVVVCFGFLDHFEVQLFCEIIRELCNSTLFSRFWHE
jgi:hypothetical protein